MEDMVIMSTRESKRRDIVAQVLSGKLKQTEAAALMELSYRHTNRLVNTCRQQGVKAFMHQNRGKPSPRKIPVAQEERIIALYRERYPDFGPTFASEKLRDMHHIRISRETLRHMLIRHSLFTPRKQRAQQCHPWRQRKDHRGELVQFDGSHHHWLEERLDREICLMAYIDDATGMVYARFYDYEGTMPFLDSLQRFIKKYGIPQALYLDRHSTYLTTRQASVDEDLRNVHAETQAERVVKELGSKLVFARSPQAKGRVERLFETLQDRLVKEMRLANICTIDDANVFLEHYLESFNATFMVQPTASASFFRSVPNNVDFQWTFAIRDTRVIGTDYTIRWQNRVFLLFNPSRTHRRKTVEIKQALDGSLRFSTKTSVLRVREITEHDLVSARLNHKKLERLAREYAHHAKSKKSWMDQLYIGTSKAFSAGTHALPAPR